MYRGQGHAAPLITVQPPPRNGFWAKSNSFLHAATTLLFELFSFALHRIATERSTVHIQLCVGSAIVRP